MNKKLIIIFFVTILSIKISSQDLINNDNLFVIIADKVNVRKAPNANAEVITQLRIAEITKLIKKSGIKQSINNIQGEWVYIDREGWVFDSFLADYSKFKRVKSFFNCSLKGTIGDWYMNYEFLKNGKYKKQRRDYDTGKISDIQGNIYRYKDVIILKDEGDNPSYDFLYFNEKGLLCHYFRDKNTEPICTECKK